MLNEANPVQRADKVPATPLVSDKIKELYSELKNTKARLYKEDHCANNTVAFITHLLDLPDNGIFKKSELGNRFYVIYFCNAEANTYGRYGEVFFPWHVNLLYLDSESKNWYIFDYDIERISGGEYQLDSPILAKSYLKMAFSSIDILGALSDARAGIPNSLASVQQVILFPLKDFTSLCNQCNGSLTLLVAHHSSILKFVHEKLKLSFNNLYEFFTLLEKEPVITSNPVDSIEPIKEYHRGDISRSEFFSNNKNRLGEEKLNSLINTLTPPNINYKSSWYLLSVGSSTFYKHHLIPYQTNDSEKSLSQTKDSDHSIGKSVPHLS